MSIREVDILRARYPKGTVVKLAKMVDPQAPPAGSRGVVQFVDDMCQIHVSWETGSSLALIEGEDEWTIVSKGGRDYE